ncbi:L domain-like protein [Anaeromyces robustus]|uniref:L domain-like protein n=1 Tax=Anaeromyces robustus TaxID=1754192 RepID=A0A1Y1XBT1_9FUNG|nr:L domain-like protein [Anaeromyces robustus]|eukprot:ORX83220.1 L domain-like protein [Anaeromyces robustus]
MHYHQTPLSHLMKCEILNTFPSKIQKLNQLETLDLTGLRDLKENDIARIPKSVKYLTFGKTEFKQYMLDELSTLNNLRSLEFYLTIIKEGLNFKKLGNLKKLTTFTISNAAKGTMSDVNRQIVPKKYLKYFRIIKQLNIDAATFNKASLDEIGSLTKLEKLSITDSEFEDDATIHSFKQLKNLKSLVFNCNDKPIKSISSSIYYLTNLESLTISNQLNAEFHTSSSLNFSKLKNLKTLYLSSNNATINFNHFKGLNKLTTLKLNGEYIPSISNAIGSLTSLKTLELMGSNIETLSNSIGKLKKLQSLDLYDNKITKIPSSIGNLRDITTITMSHNKITNIPKSLGNLAKLETLLLNKNEIDDELPESLNKLPKLSYIDVSYNKNIRGKTLTNDNIGTCSYVGINNKNVYSLCISKVTKCIGSTDLKKLKLCDSN